MTGLLSLMRVDRSIDEQELMTALLAEVIKTKHVMVLNETSRGDNRMAHLKSLIKKKIAPKPRLSHSRLRFRRRPRS